MTDTESTLSNLFQDWIHKFHQSEIQRPHGEHHDQVEWLTMKIVNKSIAKQAIWMIGIGKSGLVGHYFCQMLQSIGMCSHVLEPTNALHGDIGAVRTDDLVIFISKGGRNPEFINIIKSCQLRKVDTVAISCHTGSLLVNTVGGTGNSVILPDPVEDKDWNVLPTTSILCFHYFVMLVIIKVKNCINMPKTEYYSYHPRGRIGELLQHHVRDIMKPLPDAHHILKMNSSLREALVYFTHHGLSRCILVDENGKLQGVLSDRGIHEWLLRNEHPLDEPISKIVHPAEITTTPDTELVDLERQLDKVDLNYLSEIPVIEKGGVVGLISHKILSNQCK